MCDALRRAKELALDVGAIADGVGWPCLWLPEHVLIYGPRPDGKCQIDDLTDKDEIYYVTQVERALADGFVSKSSLELFHVNRPVSRNAVAMPNTCVARVGAGPVGLPPPLAECEGNQVLWIADTGCGSNLVPESDVVRGVSQVVEYKGGRRMLTANGEVDAPESVRFTLPELDLKGQLATILPMTPRVLTVGGLCVDQRCDFIWRGSRGELPFFVLADG